MSKTHLDVAIENAVKPEVALGVEGSFEFRLGADDRAGHGAGGGGSGL